MDDTTTGKHVMWNSQIERILSEEGERALCFSWLHTKSQNRYSEFNNYIAIPTIVLSHLAGTAAIGSTALFAGLAYTNIGIGCVSFGVGILNTLSSHFGWAKRAEAHRIISSSYSKIHRFIVVELSLPRTERVQAHDMLKYVREQLDRLQETSPQIPDSVIQKFKEKFENTTPEVSKPEITNGLDPITVYVEGVSPSGEAFKISTSGHTPDKP
jgi:hypothetical protein